MIWLGLVLSSISGLFLGLVGGGGSLLIVPILHYVMGFDALQATFTSLVVVGLVSLIGAFVHAKNKNVEFKRGALFAAPAIVGVLTSRWWLLPHLPSEIKIANLSLTKDAIILLTFGFVMFAAAVSMLRRERAQEIPLSAFSVANIFKVLMLSLGVGLLTGFVGAGGGFLIVPALVSLFKMPMKIAVGTSLAVIALNSLVGVLATGGPQDFPYQNVFFITSATLAGFFFGKSMSTKFSNRQLKVLFAMLIFFVASFMIVKELI